ncbi:hypothetical protein BRAS3809_330009 [Bradyrhizobium sp. STM 3809]|nr:hypothetical protein BRAS3809_330009 [Bradyrhizobium sp. STM 3809]
MVIENAAERRLLKQVFAKIDELFGYLSNFSRSTDANQFLQAAVVITPGAIHLFSYEGLGHASTPWPQTPNCLMNGSLKQRNIQKRRSSHGNPAYRYLYRRRHSCVPKMA